MRIFLLPLACALVFAGIGRAEFDAGPAKPKATQSAFDGIASSRSPQKVDLYTVQFLELGNLVIAPVQFPMRLAPCTATPGARVKVTHRPANVPSQPYAVNPIGYYWDGAMTK
jgi:hypothetical protein